MTPFFLAAFILGLLLGVFSMIAGIDRDQRRGPWVKYINLPTVGTAVTLLGLVGYPLAKYTALSPFVISGIAGGVAILGAIGMVIIIAGWAVPSAERDVEDERYRFQGHPAHVTKAIQTDSHGEIVFEDEGKRYTSVAAGLDGKAIEKDAEVVIERIENGVAYVELWATIAQQLELPS